MITITGKSVFGGVSIGKLSFYKRNQKVIKREHVENVESECVRFQEAKAEGIRQLIVRKIDCRCRRSQRYDF